MSKVEEINTVEKIEGDKIYEDSSIMGVKAAIRLQPRPRRPDSKHKSHRNPNRKRRLTKPYTRDMNKMKKRNPNGLPQNDKMATLSMEPLPLLL